VFLETSGVSSGVSTFLWRTGEVREGWKGVCVCLCVCDGDSHPPRARALLGGGACWTEGQVEAFTVLFMLELAFLFVGVGIVVVHTLS
jgi:hypothetical protein